MGEVLEKAVLEVSHSHDRIVIANVGTPPPT